jgi:magnesium-transporting ATPase (P-type)
MSVICRNEIDNKFRCFVKGSPEMISKLCTKVPPNFKETLQEYT